MECPSLRSAIPTFLEQGIIRIHATIRKKLAITRIARRLYLVLYMHTITL